MGLWSRTWGFNFSKIAPNSQSVVLNNSYHSKSHFNALPNGARPLGVAHVVDGDRRPSSSSHNPSGHEADLRKAATAENRERLLDSDRERSFIRTGGIDLRLRLPNTLNLLSHYVSKWTGVLCQFSQWPDALVALAISGITRPPN
jgi:hypothetical protein